MLSRLRYPLLLALVLAPALTACQRGGPPVAAGKGVPVTIAPVLASTVTDYSQFISSLQSRHSVTLSPQVQGHITRIFVHSGDAVAAGAPLMEIDPQVQQATVQSDQAAVASALAQVRNAQGTLQSLQAQIQEDLANLKYNQTQYQRYHSLYTQGAVTLEQVDQYADSLSTAQAQLHSLQAQIQAQVYKVAQDTKQYHQDLANLRGQQAQLGYFTVTAPFAGTVGDIPVRLGDYVTTSSQLTTLTQNRFLEVYVYIPAQQAPRLHLGLPLQVLDTQGKILGATTISFISPTVDPTTQTVLVKGILDNASGALRTSEFVVARVVWSQHPGVLVPTSAVSNIVGQNFVFVAEPKGPKQFVARQQPVQLGPIQGNDYQVLEGLKPGQEIVTAGIQKLVNGAPLAPQS